MIPRHLIIAVAILLAITLGMGFYVVRMRARVDRTDVSSANTQPVAPPSFRIERASGSICRL